MSIKVTNPNAPRAFTNALIENAEQMVFSWEEIARAALGWMSEDDVQRMCESEFDMEAEEEEDEDEEDDDPDPDDSDDGPAAYDENGNRLEAGDKVEWNGGKWTVDAVLSEKYVRLVGDFGEIREVFPEGCKIC